MSVDMTPAVGAAHNAFGYYSVELSPERSSTSYTCTGVQWEDQDGRTEDDQTGRRRATEARCQILEENCPDGMPAPAPGWTVTRDGTEWTVVEPIRRVADLGWRLTLVRHVQESSAPEYWQGR